MLRDHQDTVRIFLCVKRLSLTIARSISASIRHPRSSFKVILSGSSDCPAVIINEHHHFTTATHNEHANSSCVVRHRARQVPPEMPYEIICIYSMTWNALRDKYLQPMSENWTVRPPSFFRYLCLMVFRAMYFSIDRKEKYHLVTTSLTSVETLISSQTLEFRPSKTRMRRISHTSSTFATYFFTSLRKN